MRTQLRIVAGALRGRKLTVQVGADLRPTPLRVREALFSILGNAIPERPFFDVFAGTGVNGLEALSRGASAATFIERDFRLAQDIDRHLRAFQIADLARVLRTDAYRWGAQWRAPVEPVNVFLSPPFADLRDRLENFLDLVSDVQRKAAPGAVLVIQSERHSLADKLPAVEEWDQRHYGRNELHIWVKEDPNRTDTPPPNNEEE